MLEIFKQFIAATLRPIPTVLGRKLRYFFYKNQFASCGKNVIIDEGVHLMNPELMYLGNDIWLDKNTLLIAGPFDPKGRKYVKKGENHIKEGRLHISDGVHIAPFSLVQAHGGVSIGKEVTIASGAKVYSLSHHYRNLENKEDTLRYSFSTMAPTENQFLITGNVLIGDYAAVGLNSVVLPGVSIPNGTWLAAGSVVNSSCILEPDSIYNNH